MFDMEVIVRRQNQEHCASITCMIRHYVARRAKVIEDHPHNAADRAICNLVAPQFAAETDLGGRCLTPVVLGRGVVAMPRPTSGLPDPARPPRARAVLEWGML